VYTGYNRFSVTHDNKPSLVEEIVGIQKQKSKQKKEKEKPNKITKEKN
jgi:hypothetical protein